MSGELKACRHCGGDHLSCPVSSGECKCQCPPPTSREAALTKECEELKQRVKVLETMTVHQFRKEVFEVRCLAASRAVRGKKGEPNNV